MHEPMPRRAATIVAARAAAAVMVGCALMHVVGAVRHWSPALSLPTIGVAAGCLHCVPGLWGAPRVRDWVWVTLGSAAMLILHLVMLARPGGSVDHAHGRTVPATIMPTDPPTVTGLALPLIGLALAWWALGTLRSVDQHTRRCGWRRAPAVTTIAEQSPVRRRPMFRGLDELDRLAGSLGVGVPLDDHRPDGRRNG